MDIEMISCLWDQFRRSGYIPKSPASLASLKAKCKKYISFWAAQQPTVEGRANRYVGNAFLPLELIDDDDNTASHDGEYSSDEDETARRKQKCTKCRRFLTADSFSRAQWRREENLSCLVCVAITENLVHWHLRDRAIARRAAQNTAAAAPTRTVAVPSNDVPAARRRRGAQKTAQAAAATTAAGPSNSASTGWRSRAAQNKATTATTATAATATTATTAAGPSNASTGWRSRAAQNKAATAAATTEAGPSNNAPTGRRRRVTKNKTATAAAKTVAAPSNSL
jgi:hypothetical protein